MNAIAPKRVLHQNGRRLVEVVRTEDITPRTRRIVLGGASLEGFVSAAPDDHVKLFFPAPGQNQPVLPDGARLNGGLLDGGVIARDYTPRRYDPATGEMTIDFVLHEAGPASDWARQAAPGAPLSIGGPRGSFVMAEDFDTYLLAGDETALPAIARRMEEMRPGQRAAVFVEIAGAAEERYLPSAANVSLTWLHRRGAPPGTGTRLLDALRSWPAPPGRTHAWLAGEIGTIRALRAYLTDGLGLPRQDVRASGYWRIGEAGVHTKLED